VSPVVEVHGPFDDDGLIGHQTGGEGHPRPYLSCIVGDDGVTTVGLNEDEVPPGEKRQSRSRMKH